MKSALYFLAVYLLLECTAAHKHSLKIFGHIRGGAEFDSNDKTSGGIQYMITHRMRRILIESLGYLPDEVDSMDPQVAAVVIERGLSRPSKGMPLSWRQNRQDGSRVQFLYLFIRSKWVALNNCVREFVLRTTGDSTRLASLTPLIALLALVVFKGQVAGAGIFVTKKINESLIPILFAPVSKFKNFFHKPKSQPVNLQYLEDLRRGSSWSESFSLRFSEIRRKFQ